MAHTSLLEWTNSIRLTMANDPGRQYFHDQVQTHGFLFLDHYLDNILSGAKQDPLIDLVKTPGRKKAVVKKPKLASKLHDVVTLSLEEEEGIGGKEKFAPVNNFHKALLQAQEHKQEPVTHPGHFHPSSGNVSQQSPRLEKDVTDDQRQPLGNHSDVPHEASSVLVYPPGYIAPSVELLAPTYAEQTELSVIAEDDETAERSRISIQFVRHEPDLSTSLTEQRRVSTESAYTLEIGQESTRILGNNVPVDPLELSQREVAMDITISSDTFHSIPLDSPQAPSQRSLLGHRHLPSPSAPHTEKYTKETSDTSYSVPHSFTAPLPEIPPWNPRSTSQQDNTTSPLPVIRSATAVSTLIPTTLDIDILLRDPDSEAPSHKTSVSVFPSLPAPMPLRKSMRALRDPSMGLGNLGAATPSAPVGGKRTSWLMKAREVKAMEGASKKVSILGGNIGTSMVPGMGSNKRKSGDMLTIPGIMGLEEERKSKAAKHLDTDIAPLKSKDPDKGKEKESRTQHNALERQATPEPPQSPPAEPEGMLDRFKKTVEGLGARVGKSMGKSLGGNAAASALAEARAAAEARVAERHHKEEEMTMAMGAPVVSRTQEEIPHGLSPVEVKEPLVAPTSVTDLERRLSVSDLFPTTGSVKGKSKEPAKVFQFAPSVAQDSRNNEKANRESTTTTPPNSPPPSHPGSFALPSGPVFNKPPPVFVPPAPVSKSAPSVTSPKDPSFNLPPSTAFSMPASMSLGLAPHLPSPLSSNSKQGPLLSTQSTLESVQLDFLLGDREMPSWMPSTQDTEYSSGSGFGTHLQHNQNQETLDEDDSWPIDEKLAAGVQWTFGAGSKEDSMTWSTLPSESQRADMGPSYRDQLEDMDNDEGKQNRQIPGAFDMEVGDDEYEGDEELVVGDSELEEMVMNHNGSTVSLVEPKITRSQSQLSMASSASSQSQAGFLGQASKLISSALGTSKKGKPEVKKVLQMAAVAAKKQQEESDKKTARLKEMENRRQLAMQRKAEEEKSRAQEQERKLKEEGERRKREREEHTDKRPLKAPSNKKEDDSMKKRKITVEVEKKPEVKKPAVVGKPVLKPALKQPAALSSSAAYNTSLQTNTASTSNGKASELKSTTKAPTTAVPKSKGKVPMKAAVPDDDVTQPSQIVHTQMAARAKAQIKAAKQAAEPIPSESIELPDINSEYSDSEDEDRPRTFDPPDWAQSPELRQALQVQSTINPDDIFGAIRPLRMEELFRTRTSRFRARTSSANWTGSDRLTLEEEREYARRMGFR